MMDIYGKLQDEKSRKIYKALENNGNFLELWEKTDDFDNIYEKLQTPYIIYGAGTCTKSIIKLLKKLDVLKNCIGIWDNNPNLKGMTLENINIASPEHSKYCKNTPILIGLSERQKAFNEVCENLINLGYTDIIKPFQTFFINPKQYFDEEIIIPNLFKDEIFIDGGCYDFADCRRFIELAPSVEKIIAFEPDEDNYIKCVKNAENYDFIQIEKSGMWFCDTDLKFTSSVEIKADSHISENGDVIINVQALDNITDKATFIKMDIEGAELEALKGCQNIIKNHRPKLAIAIYHKSEDYIEIPKYILSLVPDYKLYIRTYKLDGKDTVLYCV